MQNNPDFYYIPTSLDKTMAYHIMGLVERDFLRDGRIEKDNTSKVDKGFRICKTGWIPHTHWISGMMAHYIKESNQKFFKYDLTGWASDIQYTEYDQKGSHYTWHCDTRTKETLSNGCETRKLSISLLLSDPDEYEGGEFQIMHMGDKDMTTIKPPIGYAIIFPSTSRHRVRPIKSGVRTSLVGWYGGPNFR